MNANRHECTFPRLSRLDRSSSNRGLKRGKRAGLWVCASQRSLVECKLNSVSEFFVFKWTHLSRRMRRNESSVPANWLFTRLFTVSVEYHLFGCQTDGHEKQWHALVDCPWCFSSSYAFIFFFSSQGWYSLIFLFLWISEQRTCKTWILWIISDFLNNL